jgi:hypothetical protein
VPQPSLQPGRCPPLPPRATEGALARSLQWGRGLSTAETDSLRVEPHEARANIREAIELWLEPDEQFQAGNDALVGPAPSERRGDD